MHALPRQLLVGMAWAGLALATTASHAVELRGFRGVPWGAGVDSLGPVQLASASGEVSCYRRQHENMLFGDSPLKDVRFCFHDDHLFMVAVDAATDVETLVQEFAATYGPPDGSASTKTIWGNRTTRARVEMVAPAQGSASMLLYSNEFEPHDKAQGKAF